MPVCHDMSNTSHVDLTDLPIISFKPCSCLTLVASVSVLKYDSYQDSSIRFDLKGVMGVSIVM